MQEIEISSHRRLNPGFFLPKARAVLLPEESRAKRRQVHRDLDATYLILALENQTDPLTPNKSLGFRHHQLICLKASL